MIEYIRLPPIVFYILLILSGFGVDAISTFVGNKIKKWRKRNGK